MHQDLRMVIVVARVGGKVRGYVLVLWAMHLLLNHLEVIRKSYRCYHIGDNIINQLLCPLWRGCPLLGVSNCIRIIGKTIIS